MRSLAGKKIRIAFAGGGSGGHIYPLIAVAASLQEQARTVNAELELHYFGANDRFRKDIEAQGIRFHSLLTGKLRRYASIMTLLDIPKTVLGFIQALFKLYVLMPDAIFSKGGPGAIQVVAAGWFYKTPVIIHESDSVPGLTTLVSARFARKVAISFEQAAQYFNPQKVILSGNPVRPDLLTGRLSQEEAKRKLGFDPARPLLLVTGGSLGARKLNEFMILNLGAILPVAQVLHQAGPENFLEAKKLSEAELLQLPTEVSTRSRYSVAGYLGPEESKDALCAADVILARAGSGTIFEAAAFAKPIILVPLPSSASDHQRANARAFAEAGGAVVIDESNLTPNIFMNELQKVIGDPAKLQSMGQASAAFARPDASQTLAAAVLEMAQ